VTDGRTRRRRLPSPFVELDAATAEAYLRRAFTELLDVAEELGDPKVNERPLGPTTNAVAALIVHCCGLTEFWLGHVGLGRASSRDRDSEFSATATVAELRRLVDATLRTVGDDLRRIEAGEAVAASELREFLPDAATSDGALVLHVLEELYQHLGHAELSADVLGAR